MITVCDGGWSRHLGPHPRVVLKNDGRGDAGVSHGMCPRCNLLCQAEMDGIAPRALEEYAAYLGGPFDPRD